MEYKSVLIKLKVGFKLGTIRVDIVSKFNIILKLKQKTLCVGKLLKSHYFLLTILINYNFKLLYQLTYMNTTHFFPHILVTDLLKF